MEDNAHWLATMREASECVSASKMRDLFAIMLTQCGEMPDPREIWDTFGDHLSEDFLHRTRERLNNRSVGFSEEIYMQALIALEDKVLELGGKCLQEYDLPATDRSAGVGLQPKEVLRERAYDIQELQQFTAEKEKLLRPEQGRVYNTLLQAVQRESGELFFLDAPGGTGKTFVTNLLMAKVRQHRKIVVAVASSGIAAQLLVGGRTSHSAFKIPLDLTSTNTPTCNVSKGSGLAEMLKQCSLIIWDECTMTHRKALEAVERLLRDIRGNSGMMGNVTVVLSGDFRQTLPVVKRGTPADELRACLKSSALWKKVKILKLTENMRAKIFGDASSARFAEDLLTLGEGRAPRDKDGLVDMTQVGRVVSGEEELIGRVFPNFETRYSRGGQ